MQAGKLRGEILDAMYRGVHYFASFAGGEPPRAISACVFCMDPRAKAAQNCPELPMEGSHPVDLFVSNRAQDIDFWLQKMYDGKFKLAVLLLISNPEGRDAVLVTNPPLMKKGKAPVIGEVE